MSTVLLDLGDCILTDTGEVIVRPDTLTERLRKGESIDGLCTFHHQNVSPAMEKAIFEFNRRREPEQKLRLHDIDNTPGEFPARLYEWKIPVEYHELDLVQHIVTLLERHFPELPPEYVERVQLEYGMMMERGMEDFLRLIIYIMDTIDQHDIVHGIGRGSACSSLILYLIGVHMVDPILYDIPITEFLR